MAQRTKAQQANLRAAVQAAIDYGLITPTAILEYLADNSYSPMPTRATVISVMADCGVAYVSRVLGENEMNKPVAQIYCIRNTVTNRMYIGASKNTLKTRLSGHLSKMKSGFRCECMKEDYDKYGKDSFTIELVEYVYDENLIEEIENYWIEKYSGSNLYNRIPSRYKACLSRKKVIFGSIGD